MRITGTLEQWINIFCSPGFFKFSALSTHFDIKYWPKVEWHFVSYCNLLHCVGNIEFEWKKEVLNY